MPQPFIETIVLILSSFGLIILLLSGFLVINAITALITQQIPQIGVMKLDRRPARADHEPVHRHGAGLWADRHSAGDSDWLSSRPAC